MKDEDLKSLWKKNNPEEQLIFDHLKLSEIMEQKVQKFEKDIQRRNLREILAALVIIVFFTYQLFSTINPGVKIGSGLLVMAGILIIIKLVMTRNSKPTISFQASVKEHLEQTKTYLMNEKKLLDSVMFWYILPLMIPLAIITYSNPYHFIIKMAYVIFIIGVSVFVYLWNRKAGKEIQVQIIEMDKAIAGMEH